MRQRHLLIAALLTLQLAATAPAKPPALLELKSKDQTWQGRLVTMAGDCCWLMGRDGRLDRIELDRVESHRVAAPRFQRYSPAELRDQLRREFGKNLEVAGTEHYLVCGPRGKAAGYAQIFEDVYRTFHVYASTRGFRVTRPEFPLVAVVFPDRKAFADYCRQDGFRASGTLAGYYMPTSNRVALFESGTAATSATGSLFETFAATGRSPIGPQPFGRIDGDLHDTMIHEAVHQVAFNVGLHSRIGENPKWVVEGLATVFEAPGIRNSASNVSVKTRINRERFVWFGNYAAERRKPKSLASFVRSDALFQTSVLDAYSEAWALSFYLIETRPSEYARYLKTIAERDPLKDYSSNERLADFQRAFGNDLTLLEAEFLRFIERLN